MDQGVSTVAGALDNEKYPTIFAGRSRASQCSSGLVK